jgi:hypothetical protein
MVTSKANSVSEYLSELEAEQRKSVRSLRTLVKKHLPQGYVEAMAFGMIGYQVPLEISGPTYNKQPIGPVAIAAQKHGISLYLLSIYASKKLTNEFKKRWLASGKKLDMGKSCIRFKNLEQADLETIAWAVGLLDPQEFTQMYLRARADYAKKSKS